MCYAAKLMYYSIKASTNAPILHTFSWSVALMIYYTCFHILVDFKWNENKICGNVQIVCVFIHTDWHVEIRLSQIYEKKLNFNSMQTKLLSDNMSNDYSIDVRN